MNNQVLIDRETALALLDEGPRSETWAAQDKLRAALQSPAPEGGEITERAQPEVANNTGSSDMANKTPGQGHAVTIAVEDVASTDEAAVGNDIFAWATFDGEGGYDLRLYEGNEDYLEQWLRQGERYAEWVTPLMTIAQHRAIVAGLGREWISINDRLPEIARRLDRECRVGSLTIAPLNVSIPVLAFDGEKVLSTRLEWFDNCLPLPYRFSHWMPLPPSPKEGGL